VIIGLGGSPMRRREFITLVGGAAAWPLAARAQQPAMRVIGFLGLGSPSGYYMEAFRKGLSEMGYVEGRNVAIAFRFADNQSGRLPELAADLVRSQVAVIVAPDGAALFAAKAATSTIPIVFTTGLDPVKYGLVASLNRPGGNMTGVAMMSTLMSSKQLDLLREMVPQATTFGYLFPGRVRTGEEKTSDISDMIAASRALGAELVVAEVLSAGDIETAFATLGQRGTGGLVVGPYALFNTISNRILGLTARNRIAAIYYHPSWVMRGGLMSYSASVAGIRNAIVDYVGRILKGAKPADLPVQQPTKFELVINRKTAKALGIEVPPTLLAIADEVIE
jgi:putative tryptophan/tyrosine transport system substrate-binding protein